MQTRYACGPPFLMSRSPHFFQLLWYDVNCAAVQGGTCWKFYLININNHCSKTLDKKVLFMFCKITFMNIFVKNIFSVLFFTWINTCHRIKYTERKYKLHIQILITSKFIQIFNDNKHLHFEPQRWCEVAVERWPLTAVCAPMQCSCHWYSFI